MATEDESDQLLSDTDVDDGSDTDEEEIDQLADDPELAIVSPDARAAVHAVGAFERLAELRAILDSSKAAGHGPIHERPRR